jgi:hypothetical protein
MPSAGSRPRLSQLVHEQRDLKEAHEAVVLLKHLTRGREEDAIIAYRAFASLIKNDLEVHPGIQEEYAEILDQLTAFLEAEGFAWAQGQWTANSDAERAGALVR